MFSKLKYNTIWSEFWVNIFVQLNNKTHLKPLLIQNITYKTKKHNSKAINTRIHVKFGLCPFIH